MAAAGQGDASLVKLLLTKYEANMHIRTPEGYSALDLAVMSERSANISALIDAGCKIDSRGLGGATALILASHWGSAKSIEHLMKLDADPAIQAETGETALHLAVKAGHRDAVAALLKGGADSTVKDKAGRTPADLAPPLATPTRHSPARPIVWAGTGKWRGKPGSLSARPTK